jgi:hypothetical protein
MNRAVIALVLVILASPCAADDSALWKLIAHSNLAGYKGQRHITG